MLTIKEVKAIRYAIANHYRGWQLLKNPEGVSGTTVRMIRTAEEIDGHTLDTFSTTSRVTTDFSKSVPEVSNENLFVNKYNFYDSSNKLTDTRRYVTYVRENSDGKHIVRGKGNVSDDVLAARNFDSLHIPSVDRFETYTTPSPNDITGSDYSTFTVSMKRSFAYLQKEKFEQEANSKSIGKMFNGSFWKTLWQNIKQK